MPSSLRRRSARARTGRPRQPVGMGAVAAVIVLGGSFAGATAGALGGDTDRPIAVVSTGDEPAPDPTSDPEPDPTPEPVQPDPEPDDGDASDADDADEGRDIPWGTVFVISVALLAILVVLAVISAIIHRRPAPAVPRPSGSQRALGDVRWLHDQLSIDVLTGPADTARSRWLGQRPVVDAMARDAQQRATVEPRAGWADLAEEIARLARALDTATATRVDPATDPAMVSEAITVVNQVRQDLLARIDAVRRRTRG